MAHTAITEEKYFKEVEDTPDVFEAKVAKLVEYIKASKHFIVFTGAGISTSAGIPDFRGPEGVWTLAAQNRQRTKKSVSTVRAYPTITHMSLVGLQNANVLKYLVFYLRLFALLYLFLSSFFSSFLLLSSFSSFRSTLLS